MKAFSKNYQTMLKSKGVVFDSLPQFMIERDEEGEIAMDSQQGLVTVGSSGVPAYLTNFIDPKAVNVVFSPMNATNIFGEVVKGSWTDKYATFKVVEHTGEVATYGDYNNAGLSGLNVNFPQRQSYIYQIITQYGDLEVEEGALAQVDFITEKNAASILALNKFQNYTYLYGISGLMCYGILNDPSLSAPIAPGPKAYNSNATGPWITSGVVTATPNEIYKDVQSLVYELISQSKGLVDADTSMKMVMSPLSMVALTASNEIFSNSAKALILSNFKNITFEAVPEYATALGNVVQLIADSIDGQKTGECATNLKLRSGRIIPDLSSFKQKKSQGTWGAIIKMPMAIAQMIAV